MEIAALHVGSERRNGLTVLKPVGEVDVYTCPQLRDALVEASSERGARVVVDLRQTTFIDSMGLGVLLSGLKRARSHEGSLELVCSDEKVLRILRLTGLDKVFVVQDDLPEETSG